MSASRNRIEQLAGGRYIFAHISVCKVAGGLHEGILLEYFIRWAKHAADGWAFRTETEIEADTLINRHFQRKARATLVSKGLLDEIRRGAPARNYYRVHYDLLDELLGQDSDDDDPCLSRKERVAFLEGNTLPDKKGEGFPTNKGDTVEEPLEEPKSNISRATPQKRTTYTPEFEDFWRHYPQSYGKSDAFKAWQQIAPENWPEVMTGLAEWKQCQRWQEGFVKDCAAWLKKGWWAETPPPARAPTQPTTGKTKPDFGEMARRMREQQEGLSA